MPPPPVASVASGGPATSGLERRALARTAVSSVEPSALRLAPAEVATYVPRGVVSEVAGAADRRAKIVEVLIDVWTRTGKRIPVRFKLLRLEFGKESIFGPRTVYSARYNGDVASDPRALQAVGEAIKAARPWWRRFLGRAIEVNNSGWFMDEATGELTRDIREVLFTP